MVAMTTDNEENLYLLGTTVGNWTGFATFIPSSFDAMIVKVTGPPPPPAPVGTTTSADTSQSDGSISAIIIGYFGFLLKLKNSHYSRAVLTFC